MAIQKKISTIFLSALIAVFLIQAIAATALILMPATAQADSTFTFEVPILHGQEQTVTFNSKSGTKPIADYIKTIYTFAVGAVGIVAAVVLMIGGVMWITAGGNASNVSEAKSMITASLTGMVLVLCSYLILGQVNPALVNLQSDLIGTPPLPTQTPTIQSIVNSPAFQAIVNSNAANSCNWTESIANTFLNGCVKSADSLCAGDKSKFSSPSCCCTYNIASACSPWSASPCATNLITVDGGSYTEKNIKACGSNTDNGNSSYCCCKLSGGTSGNF